MSHYNQICPICQIKMPDDRHVRICSEGFNASNGEFHRLRFRETVGEELYDLITSVRSNRHEGGRREGCLLGWPKDFNPKEIFTFPQHCKCQACEEQRGIPWEEDKSLCKPMIDLDKHRRIYRPESLSIQPKTFFI
jgi:hypothetical protein